MKENGLKNNLDIEILISTMNRTSLSFLDSMFPYNDVEKLNILIINQTTNGKELFSNKYNIRVLNSFETGLSISRNLAIQNATGDICLIADDDVEYFPNFQETIKQSFINLKTTSIIRFKIETFEGVAYKNYPATSKRISNKKGILGTSSIEIAFRRLDIVNNNIIFNTLFGLGSYFKSGEEYLFLKEGLAKNLTIKFENKSIVKHSSQRSTSNMGDENFIKAQSAIYYIDYAIFSYLYLLKFVLFLWRKGIISINEIVTKFYVGVSAIREYKELTA